MKTLFVVSVVLAAAAPVVLATSPAGQQPPAADTDVFVATWSGTTRVTVGPLTNISQRVGYDNQPSFTPDGRAVLFTSGRTSNATDIFRFDLASHSLVQLTRTAEAEYSPLTMPDGAGFSVIRVERDGTQRLWKFRLDGTSPALVLERVKPVGYHVWIDATHLALFVLGAQGQPNSLQIADTATGEATMVEAGIGRSLHRRPGTGTISFVSTPREGRWSVKEYDPRTRQVTTLVEIPDDARGQDNAWDLSGRLVMTSGTRLLAWRTGEAGWTEVANLAGRGVDRLTRLAFAPTRSPSGTSMIAFVAEPAAR